MTARILAFAGSARSGSWNKKLVAVAASAARAAGGETTLVDLADFPMPIYDADLEAASGLPEHAKRLKALFLANDALLLSCPEFNSSITALLKNAIDWVSRPAPGEGSLACFAGKTAALMSASPGALGGLRGLVHVRAILGNIGVLVLPTQVAVPKAHEAFEADGSLKDAKQRASIEKLAAELVATTSKLRS
jgi:NAD(P)H-dependent FMN reductase